MAEKIDLIKQLREATAAGFNDCKKAIDEAGGDKNRAIEILKKKGLDIAQRKSSRAVRSGRMEAYVHLGAKIGVLVEINCESDFVAQNENFVKLAKEVAMQIAASCPTYVDLESVPDEEKDKLKDEGVKKDFAKQNCLLDQPFIKDSKKSVREHITDSIAKLGENIVVRRFVRMSVGE